MKISIGNDHAGPDYKKAIVKQLVPREEPKKIVKHVAKPTKKAAPEVVTTPQVPDAAKATLVTSLIERGKVAGVLTYNELSEFLEKNQI